MERRKFTKEFKQEAVQLSYDSDRSIVEMAQNLGISPRLLYRTTLYLPGIPTSPLQ